MNLEKIVDQTFYWIDENARRSAMALSQKLSGVISYHVWVC